MRAMRKFLTITLLVSGCPLGASCFAQDTGYDNQSPAWSGHRLRTQFISTQCDGFGERCAQVVCNAGGGGCTPTGVRYYTPAHDGYYSGREVCDAAGMNCHYLPSGDR